ncbi:hypothetical protein ACFL4J_01415 [Candidatus Margulisiibacteriota bacterium]
MLAKRVLLISGLIFCLALAVGAQVKAAGVREAGFFPIYPVLGTASPGDTGLAVDGRLAVMYEPNEAGQIAAIYGYATIADSKFMINPFRTGIVEVGKTYKVAIARGEDNYGADPVDLTISGLGFDRVSAELVLAYGAGPTLDLGAEPLPAIQIWFNNRLYQPALVAKGETFIVPAQPEVKVEVTIADPYTLAQDISSYSIVVDPDTTDVKDLILSAGDMTQKIYAAGTVPEEEKISAMSIEYALSEAEALAEGEHIFVVTARSSGAIGSAATASETAQVTVMGGPPRMVGTPITFPSPYSKTDHDEVIIQYTLSSDTPVQIILVDIAARRVKSFVFEAGAEGGSAGLNKVNWNGVTDRGTLVGNGIYVGTILARDEARKLGSFKLTVVD